MSSIESDIFNTLLAKRKKMTASEIARAIKQPRQKVSYHLPTLVRSGLIIQDKDHYFCQPLFLNTELVEKCGEYIKDISLEILDNIYFEDESMEYKKSCLSNCVKTLFGLLTDELICDR